MKYITRLLFTLIVLFSTTSHANESFNTIDMTLRSYHIKDRCYAECSKKFNESNLGIGISWYATKNVGLIGGVLENSFNKQSAYLTVNFTGTAYRNNHIVVRPGFALGAINGYDDVGIDIKGVNDAGIAPVISPNVSLYTKRFHMNLGAMPSANTAILIFRAGVRF